MLLMKESVWSLNTTLIFLLWLKLPASTKIF